MVVSVNVAQGQEPDMSGRQLFSVPLALLVYNSLLKCSIFNSKLPHTSQDSYKASH